MLKYMAISEQQFPIHFSQHQLPMQNKLMGSWSDLQVLKHKLAEWTVHALKRNAVWIRDGVRNLKKWYQWYNLCSAKPALNNHDKNMKIQNKKPLLKKTPYKILSKQIKIQKSPFFVSQIN